MSAWRLTPAVAGLLCAQEKLGPQCMKSLEDQVRAALEKGNGK